MADIPGIIEGASKGKGLGHYFLRHIERNSILLFLISSESKKIVNQYSILINELNQYNPELIDKDRLIVISKSDLISDDQIKKISNEIGKEIKEIPFTFISSVTNHGLIELKDCIWEVLNETTN